LRRWRLQFCFLLVHEALHELVASFSWVCAGHFTGGGVDRHHRRARPADADSLRCGHAVGRGFDVLYACQDVDYDQQAGLFSIPKKFGIANALMMARWMHLGVIALLGWLAFSFGLPWPAWAGIAVVASLLAYEHSLIKANDLSKLDAAFFTVNGYISMLFLLFWGAAACGLARLKLSTDSK